MKLFIINKEKTDTNCYVVMNYFPSEFISFIKKKAAGETDDGSACGRHKVPFV